MPDAAPNKLSAHWRKPRPGQLRDLAPVPQMVDALARDYTNTRGLFVSYSGFTDQGLVAFNAKRVILMDGMDAFEALRRRISLDEVIAAKFRRGTEERRSMIPVRELFP